jgi:hypothetical protein
MRRVYLRVAPPLLTGRRRSQIFQVTVEAATFDLPQGSTLEGTGLFDGGCPAAQGSAGADLDPALCRHAARSIFRQSNRATAQATLALQHLPS